MLPFRMRIIDFFAEHKVAANLLMIAMILSGLWAYAQLNVQLFPSYAVNRLNITAIWSGASAIDIEQSIIKPIEQAVRSTFQLKEMHSYASNGSGGITLDFTQDADMNIALDNVKDSVADIEPNFPKDMLPLIIKRYVPLERVARFVIIGPENIEELRNLALRIKEDLLDRGIAKVSIKGLPQKEISIQIPAAYIAAMNISIGQIADKITKLSQNVPAGVIGQAEKSQLVRGEDKLETVEQFARLPIAMADTVQFTTLGDIADIDLISKQTHTKTWYRGKPAIEFTVYRGVNDNTLKSAKKLQGYLEELRPTLPKTVTIHVYKEAWRFIDNRITSLLKNAAMGLILLFIVLFIFLHQRIGLWVGVSIPASILAALPILYFFGASIDTISLMALIMTLGIIIDDSVVVAEESYSQLEQGKSPLDSVIIGATRMIKPVVASSLTTIFAFLPLLMVSGVFGKLLIAIPLVVISIIIASLIECFLVLPRHLCHSFHGTKKTSTSKIRNYLDNSFIYFREKIFRPFVSKAIDYRWLCLVIAFCLLFLSLALVKNGYIRFTFFEAPKGTAIVLTHIEFSPGTPAVEITKFLRHIESALNKTDKTLNTKNQSIIKHVLSFQGQSAESGGGKQYANQFVELTPPPDRLISNEDFIKSWKKNINFPPGLLKFEIKEATEGPESVGLNIVLSGKDIKELKQASLKLRKTLTNYSGLKNINDNLPYGQENIVYQINNQGYSLGLDASLVGIQLRDALYGKVVQTNYLANESLEVRISLQKEERDRLSILQHFPIVTPAGKVVPFVTVATLSSQPGFDVIRHDEGKRALHVTAGLDPRITNVNQLMRELTNKILPQLKKDYDIDYRYAGQALQQEQVLSDLEYSLIFALLLIYLTLTWVFTSYTWPFIVMIAIPFGLTGAILGHLVMGFDLSIVSLFGIFGLSGIVINDAIILLTRYQELAEEKSVQTKQQAQNLIIEATCQRLRPVLLTSITTIAGLTPLLLTTTFHEKFMTQIAISICFGLAYGTLLILVIIPCLLSIYLSLSWLRSNRSSRSVHPNKHRRFTK